MRLEIVVPEVVQRDPARGRRRFQAKRRVAGNADRDVALVGFKFVVTAARELAVEKYVSDDVLCNNLRRDDIRKNNVAFSGNMRPN